VENIIDNIKEEISEILKKAVKTAYEKKILDKIDMEDMAIEIPKDKEHGDFSSNMALQLSGKLKKSPRELAGILIESMALKNTGIEKVECAGPGFINFYIGNNYLYEALKLIKRKGNAYGKLNIGKGKKVMVEYVSANPTGPLHMGNARGGALGDCIASVLEAAGYDVTREYYINDAGNQMEKFAESLEIRYIQLLKGENAIEFPQDGYHGEDITEYMKSYIEENGESLLKSSSEERRKKLVEYALPKNLKRIKKSLNDYGIEFDVWFSEKALYDSGEIDETLNYLKSQDYTYVSDGALWFKASELGYKKDEVLVRSNGLPTYFISDLAYHRNKYIKRGFDRVINLLGADHLGHAERMKAGLKALGIETERLDTVIFQLVHLYRHGEITRMSKRTGRSISLDDLIDEVGKDAARFFFNTRASGSHLDFDLDIAVRKSNDNPVYYVQYAHARICSMLKLLKAEGIKIPDINDNVKLDMLTKEEEIDLMRKLAEYPEEIKLSVITLEPARLTRYITDTAALFHSFYNSCRVKGEEEGLMAARLVLVDCTRIVLRNALKILSISAPERM
jgi:arginyl-tRNA synthetase